MMNNELEKNYLKFMILRTSELDLLAQDFHNIEDPWELEDLRLKTYYEIQKILYARGLLEPNRIRALEQIEGWSWESDILTEKNLRWDDGMEETFGLLDDY